MVDFKYRQSNYFKEGEHYIFHHIGTDRYLVSTVSYENGSWYADTGLKYKATSVPCWKFKKFGQITKTLPTSNCLGSKDTEYYWNNVNKVLKTGDISKL